MDAERPEQDIDAELGTAPPSFEIRASMAAVWLVLALGFAFFVHWAGSRADPPVGWPAALLLAAFSWSMNRFFQAKVASRWPVWSGWRGAAIYIAAVALYFALAMGFDALLSSEPGLSGGFRQAADMALIMGFVGLLPPRRKIRKRPH